MKSISQSLIKARFAYVAVIVMVILSSFSLHAVQVPHEHAGGHEATSGHHGHGESSSFSYWSLGEYMHAAEKKLFVIPVPALLIYASVLLALYGSWVIFLNLVKIEISLLFFWQRLQCSLRLTYISYCFSRGIHNPKVYRV